ncbi:MAG: YhfC family intramembrane metalloprotease [Nitrososphaerota archaeon]|nr:YhfC family intramembrane metalloprotease [Nitrososphaerota archaeon]
MQNIDPVYFLQPIVVIAFSVGLVIYWAFKRSFAGRVLVYSFFAYAGAIATKYIVQIPTLNYVVSLYGAHSWQLGLYYGVQTMIFEVGGAFLVARYAFSKSKMNLKDSEAYGIGLSFWENGVLLGILSLLNLVSVYFILAAGPSSVAEQMYNALNTTQPALFYGPVQALRSVGLGILERVSSLFLHFSWGYLCVFAAVLKRYRYFLIALPMGLIDFFVPLAGAVSLVMFELGLFGISVLALAVAILVTRGDRRAQSQTEPTLAASPP